MKVLISGGGGFVASHLTELLLAEGHEVIAVDNFITGDRRNLEAVRDRPKFQLIEHDVSLPREYPAVDAVFHMASPASPVGYRTWPIETMLVNSQGTYHLLEHARKCGAKFLVASTSEAYGDPKVHPQTEDYWGNVNPVGVRACYDESKRYGEAMTMEYHRSLDTDTRIIRIFNTYGPRNQPDDGRVVPNFCMRALEGAPITVYGDGSQTRSFCFVSDLVEGIRRAMFTEGTAGEVINLGNPSEYTMLEFARFVNDLAGNKSEIVFEPLPESRKDDPMLRRPDISKAQRLLGWEPVVPPEEGLKRTLDWFRENALGTPASV
ncbi:MAG: SDR family oxidoreductase [Armatimonadetes bacterium]|nr:SDR family oxidoreductase [Armatimonadota bacterium]